MRKFGENVATTNNNGNGELITMADGIETVAARYERRYAPYQATLQSEWRLLQTVIRGLGAPRKITKQSYWLPPLEVTVDATHEDAPFEVVRSAAHLTVRGILRNARKSQPDSMQARNQSLAALHALRSCTKYEVPMLPRATDQLWTTVEDNTDNYQVIITPYNPSLQFDGERVRRPVTPTHEQWANEIDLDGKEAFDIRRYIAEDHIGTTRHLISLITNHNPQPGPGERQTELWDLRLRSGMLTEAGIAL